MSHREETKKRNEKATSNNQLVDMSSVDSRSASENTPVESKSRTELNPMVAGQILISSNITVSNLLETNNPDPKIIPEHDLENVGALSFSILPVNSTGVRAKRTAKNR